MTDAFDVMIDKQRRMGLKKDRSPRLRSRGKQTTRKMRVQENPGINWTWFKVQNGDLVAVFRLHYGEEQIEAFRKLEKNMIETENIKVPFATWREKCDLIANHTNKEDGYSLPEVAEAFSWLNNMFRETAGDHELESCPEGTMGHLEYHGVAICRV